MLGDPVGVLGATLGVLGTALGVGDVASGIGGAALGVAGAAFGIGGAALGVAGAAFGIVPGSAAPGVFVVPLGFVEEPGIAEPGDVDCGVLLCVPVVLRPPVVPVLPPACPAPDCATAQAPHSKTVPVKTNILCFIFCHPPWFQLLALHVGWRTDKQRCLTIGKIQSLCSLAANRHQP